MGKTALNEKYSAYPEYKDSGVEWLEDLPKHWEVKRTKTMFRLERQLVGKKSKDYQLLSLTLKGVIPRDISDGGGKIPAEFDTYQVVRPRDLIFCLFDIDETPRTIGISSHEGMITGAYNVYSALDPCIPEYAYYYFMHIDSFKGLKPFYTGLRKVVRADTFASIKMPAPSLEEQEKIANFLDYEIAKIDTLIEKQQQLIALLKEKRQAVISHAVTKGLNSNAPMKHSGVEWLGDVPEHWVVKRLKNTSDVIDCRNKTPEYFDDGEYFVVRTTNIKNQKLNMNGALYTDEANFKIWTQRGIPPAGSIFFTREAPAGEICLVPENLKFCMGQRMMNFICHDSEYTNYLFDFLLSDCLERYIESVSHGSTVSHLRVEQVENIPVIVPPADEAKAIHEELAVIKAKYSRLTAEAEKAIALMQERRTALISAAVTGKIDVRNWSADEC